MPIYEFNCNSCKHRFEELFASSTQNRAVKCPKCGRQGVEKVFSTFGTGSGGGSDVPSAGPSCGSCMSSNRSTCG